MEEGRDDAACAADAAGNAADDQVSSQDTVDAVLADVLDFGQSATEKLNSYGSGIIMSDGEQLEELDDETAFMAAVQGLMERSETRPVHCFSSLCHLACSPPHTSLHLLPPIHCSSRLGSSPPSPRHRTSVMRAESGWPVFAPCTCMVCFCGSVLG